VNSSTCSTYFLYFQFKKKIFLCLIDKFSSKSSTKEDQMSGKAAKIILTEKQQCELQNIKRSMICPQRLIQRATIILLAFEGMLNTQISLSVGIGRHQVGLWRRRWQQSLEALVEIERSETRAEFRRTIEDILSDAPRSGSPGKFTAEQVTQVVAVACEPPENSNRPVGDWSRRELADEVVARDIVNSISISHIGNLLNQMDLKPHKSRYWLNTKEKDPEVFQQQVENVCQTYLRASERFYSENIRTISVDEMCGIQALERIAPSIPMRPGQPERIEFEYKRHGTLCLIGNWDVVLGRMIAPTIGRTRTEFDFAWHIHDTIAIDPDAKWKFILDNLNTHCSASLVRLVASIEGIPKDALGKKGRRGILKSVATRREFLSDPSHRVSFVFLPKHSSWLNQIETIFGITNRRAIKRGDFTSVDALKKRLQEFIEYFNQTFAKPFNWTYTGRPTNTKAAEKPKTWRQLWNFTKNAQAHALVA
jgi:transposase